MLNFMRNKLVSIERKDEDTIIAHGFLDDDIYSLEIDVGIRISDRVIFSIEGRWNRWTTPECPRAIQFLGEAVGLCLEQEELAQIVFKSVGRKACRHFANLLVECCSSAREAIALITGDRERKEPSFARAISQEEKPGGRISRPQRLGRERKEVSAKEGEAKIPGCMVIDLHVHSYPASPCSFASADQLIEEAKWIGLDGICLTDHNYLWNAGKIEELRRKHGFLVLRENEITTDQGDMIVFGFYERIDGIIKLSELKERGSKAGGFIIVAHPFRGFLTLGVGQLGLTPEKAMERPLFQWVDAVEVLNSKVTEKENAFSREVALGLALPATGGSDAHKVSEVGLYAPFFSRNIRDEGDLVEALKNGNYRPVAF